MDFLVDAIADWLKEILVSGIIGNLSGLFDGVNEKVGEISTQVGMTPQAWNSGIFDMVHRLSENVVLPIAGILKGEMTHRAEAGADPRGNLLRLDHALDKMPERLKYVEAQLADIMEQRDAARAEAGKPFPQEDELRWKSARLAELDAELNIDGGPRQGEQAIAKSARPSVLEGLKRPPQPGPDKGVSRHFSQER